MMESKLGFFAELFAKLVFIFVALVTFYIGITSINAGLPFVPSMGLLVIGLAFLMLSISSRQILNRCSQVDCLQGVRRS